ncbi:MAG TPA: ATP-binding protein [Conexibacter sp.]
MSRVPIRLRITGAFVLVMAVVLVAIGAFVDARVRSERTRALDAELRTHVARGDAASVRAEDDERAQLLDARGVVLVASAEAGRTPLIGHDDVRRLLHATDDDGAPAVLIRRALVGGEHVRLAAQRTSNARVVVAARSLDDLDDQLAALRTTLVFGGLAALVLAGLAAYAAVAAALRPVERMRARAAAVSGRRPDARLPVPPARDEIRRLGETLNAMLDRLHEALARERRFVADASHELRTPLSILKAELELAARPSRTHAELQATVASASEETDRLVRLAEDLLVLARADRDGVPVRVEPLDAAELLHAVAERFEPRVRQAGRRLEVAATPGVALHGDGLRLEQALGNLLDNALLHGAGAIVLAAERRDGDHVRFVVRDEGPGLPPGFAVSAFERFSRADQARGRGGAGLGLAIVAAIGHAHGGTAGFEAGGGTVWIELPVRGPVEHDGVADER